MAGDASSRDFPGHGEGPQYRKGPIMQQNSDATEIEPGQHARKRQAERVSAADIFDPPAWEAQEQKLRAKDIAT
jgi:hypothetical protein